MSAQRERRGSCPPRPYRKWTVRNMSRSISNRSAPPRYPERMPDLDSEALSLFLQYVHHHRQPDLSKVSFGTLYQLAEAVEKHDVYSATEICKVQMIPYVETRCVEVFQYAYTHGYPKIMDDTALVAVQNKYLKDKFLEACNSSDLRAAWRRYTEYWFNLFVDCYEDPPPVLHRGGLESCKVWRKFRNVVVAQVRREIAIFRVSNFSGIVENAKNRLKDCRHCDIRADRWTQIVQARGHIYGSRKPFTTFLS